MLNSELESVLFANACGQNELVFLQLLSKQASCQGRDRT